MKKESAKQIAERKATKAAYDKAYRERKKAASIGARTVEVAEAPKKVAVKKETVKVPVAKVPTPKVEKEESVVVTKTFDFPVRLFWNRRFEAKNSSCAKAGVELNFEEISKDGSEITYRVRRGKRNFFANSTELAKDGVQSI
jgi:hypothetical protein